MVVQMIESDIIQNFKDKLISNKSNILLSFILKQAKNASEIIKSLNMQMRRTTVLSLYAYLVIERVLNSNISLCSSTVHKVIGFSEEYDLSVIAKWHHKGHQIYK